MKRRISSKSQAGCGLLVAWFTAVCPVLGTAALAGDNTGSDTNPRTVREDLLYVVEAYRDIITSQQLDAGVGAALESAKRELEATTDEELESVQMLGPIIQQMREHIDELTTLMYAEGRTAKLAVSSDGFPSAAYPDIDSDEFVLTILRGDLPDMIDFFGAFVIPAIEQTYETVIPYHCVGDPDGDGVANRKDDLFVMTSQNLMAAAEALRDAASRICEQDLTIVGEGGNLSVVCIITDILFIGARTVHDNLLLCEEFIDSAEIAGTYHRVGHLHDDLAVHDTAVNARLDGVGDDIHVVQETLDTTIELRQIHTQVIPLSEKDRFLLATSEGGVPIDVTLIGVLASKGVGEQRPLQFDSVPAVATPTGAPGLLDVSLDLPSNLKSAKLFQFQVNDEHVDGEGNITHQHFGTIVYERTGRTKRGG